MTANNHKINKINHANKQISTSSSSSLSSPSSPVINKNIHSSNLIPPNYINYNQISHLYHDTEYIRNNQSYTHYNNQLTSVDPFQIQYQNNYNHEKLMKPCIDDFQINNMHFIDYMANNSSNQILTNNLQDSKLNSLFQLNQNENLK